MNENIMDPVSVSELQAMTAELVEATKSYTDPTGPDATEVRKKIHAATNKLALAVKDPSETGNSEYASKARSKLYGSYHNPLLTITQMMELGVIRQFLEMKVFDAIPSHGSISYKALAEKLGGIDATLLSKSAFNL